MGESLYRDHLNREKRGKIAILATDLLAIHETETLYKSPLTEQYLTERLERDLDTLLKKWVGRVTHIDIETTCEILSKLEVLKCGSDLGPRPS